MSIINEISAEEKGKRIFVHPNHKEAEETRKKHNFNFRLNPKQIEFSDIFVNAVKGKNNYRYLFYGGAVRGGKTTVSIYCVLLYAKAFPGSRCYIIRKSAPVLKTTTMITFKDMLSKKTVKKWSYSNGDMFCEFRNGSRVYFFSESGNYDKDLNKFKGLEANLFFLEQLEELRLETFNKAIERVGTYRTKEGKVPPGLILSTFNPTMGWLKEHIYEKWMMGELKEPYYYLTALPVDNPFIGPEKYAQWADMDEVSYQRFILGNWDASDKSNLFAYAFDVTKHVVDKIEIETLPIWLSFDFNVSPMTCIMCQHTKDQTKIHIIREFRQENTGVYEFCEYIQKNIPDDLPIFVTGDPAGKARSALARENTNYYIAIADVLDIPKDRVKVANIAPTHENSWVFCNQLLTKHKGLKISRSCKRLIEDLQNVKMTADGHIEKSQTLRPGEPSIGHLLDCFRYYLHINFYKDLLK